QLVSAQRSLPQTQNQLFTIWINYQITRLQLYRDLELMPLDFRGVWIDDHATCRHGDDPQRSSNPGGRTAPQERGPDGQTGGADRLPQPRQQPPAVGPAPK